MRKLLACILLAAMVLPLIAATATKEDIAKSVLVVVNTNIKRSVEIGEYYAQKRGIPSQNICRIGCPSGDTMTAAAYNETVLPQIKKQLKGGIAYIVPVFGIPHRLTIGKTNYSLDSWLAVPNDPVSETMGTNGYNGELNPYYRHTTKFAANGKYYLVTRLDGPTADIAKELVDRAIYAEEYVSPKYGKSYFDSRGFEKKDAGFEMDKEIVDAYNEVKAAGYDAELEKTGKEFPEGYCKNALFYWGWSNIDTYKDSFYWKVGAIACHIDGKSCLALKGPYENWGVLGLKKGLTCLIGVNAVPMNNGALQLDTYPKASIFYKNLLSGMNFAEAGYSASPVNKFTTIFIGDPLYSPGKGTKTGDTENPAIVKIEAVPDTDKPDTKLMVSAELNKFCNLKLEYSAGGKSKKYSDGVDRINHKIVLDSLEPGTGYSIKAVCTDSNGNSGEQTIKAETTPKLPEKIENIEVVEKDCAVRITWDAGKEPDLEGYKIYRGLFEEGTEPVEVGIAKKDENFFLDKGLVNGKTYNYIVRAFKKGDLLSPLSEQVTAIPLELMAVENFKVEKEKNKFVLTWDKLSGKSVGGYVIYKNTKKKEKAKKLKKVIENKYVDNDVKAGETYYFVIETVGKKDEGGAKTPQMEVLN